MDKFKAGWKRQGEKNAKRSTVVVAGGMSKHWEKGNSVEMFDWTTKSWSTLPSMKQCRFGASSFIYDNQLIVAGGYNGRNCMNTMEALPTESGLETSAEWTDFAAKLPARLSGHSSVVYNDRLIVTGGYSNWGHEVRNFDGIYEVRLNSPHQQNLLMTMPEERCHHGVELLKEKMYIFGGKTTNDEGENTLDTVFMYNIKKDTTRRMAPLPFAIHGMATVNWGDNVILIGGSGKDGKALDTALIYNVKSGKSFMLPEMKHRRRGCAAVVTGNAIVVMGGWNEESKSLKSVERFTFDRYLWEDLPPMSEARFTPAAITW